MKPLTWAIVFLACLLGVYEAQAIPKCNFSHAVIDARPAPEEGPTEIQVEWFLFDLYKIDTVNQLFTADFFLDALWIDPRLGDILKKRGIDVCEASADEIWRPHMLPLNTTQLSLTLPDTFFVRDDGSVHSEQRIIGTFRADFHLHTFPLDTQVLPIEFVSTRYRHDEVEVIYKGGGYSKGFSVAGWKHQPLTGKAGKFHLNIQKNDRQSEIESLAYFAFSIVVKRDFGFYLWKVILPLFLLICVSWSVFWIDSSYFGVQATISSSMLLSIIAFLFSLQFLLPKVSYLTKMDLYVFTSLFFVFSALIVSVTSCVLATHGHKTTATKVDTTARLIFPMIFVLLNIFVWFIY